MAGISLLVADDSITIQKVIGIIFGSEDYSLTLVDNGKAALQKAQELLPDVLLIDALMPGMDGYEVCAAIRKDPQLATRPVLLLTGSFEPFDEERARQSGADDHIVKPFESQQIVAKVKELYELGKQRAGTVQSAGAAVPPPVPEQAVEPASYAFETAAVSDQPALQAFVPEQSDTFAIDPAAVFVAPVDEPAFQRAPDDPWGAFTSQPAAEPTPQPEPEPEPELSAFAGFDDAAPDVMAMLQDEQAVAPFVEPEAPSSIGASWVPVEEQTFEFREDVVFGPLPTADEKPVAAAVEPMLEPLPAVEPVVEQVAEMPPQVAEPPVASLAAASVLPALSDEQLLQAIRSASQETIERIVWEVVPDLAEAMIKEAIKRITEGA